MPLVKLALPYIVRLMTYGNPIGPNLLAFDTWIYCLAEAYVMHFLSWANYLFVTAGLVDFQRRVHMIKAIGALINPFKLEVDLNYQVFPTIMITCKDSIHSWFSLRVCAIDFGRKYMMRIFLYCSTFLAGYIFVVIILLLDFFDFIHFQLPLMLQIYALYDIIMILGVMFIMLYLGAVVNQ